MTSHTTRSFRAAFEELPTEVQERARRTYALWRNDPAHPGLQFKQVPTSRPVYSVRIGLAWRALAVKREEAVIWFWIGSQADYDKLLSKL